MGDTPERTAKTARQSAGIFGQVKTVQEADAAPEPVRDEAPVEETVAEDEIIEEAEEVEEIEYEADSEQDDEVEAVEESGADVYTVRVDGEEVEVTLDELLSGYSRTSDYTRKTQALSEQRKQFEEQKNQTLQMANVLEQRLGEVESLLSQQDNAPNWSELAKELSPQEYNQAKAQWDAQQEQLRLVRQQRQELQQQQQLEQQRQMAEATEMAREQLPKLIPEWRDQSVAQKEAQDITQWALDEGFTQEALDSLVDPLAVKILRDAWRFNRQSQKKPKVVRKKSPKTAKAGTGVKSKAKTALERQIHTPGKPREKIDFFKTIKPLK